MAAPRKAAARKVAKPKVIPTLMQPISLQMFDEGAPRIIVIGAADFIAWQQRNSGVSAGDLIRNPFDLAGWAFVTYHALVRTGECTDGDGEFDKWVANVGSIIIGDVTEDDAEGEA